MECGRHGARRNDEPGNFAWNTVPVGMVRGDIHAKNNESVVSQVRDC
jgi:hypothetical protein